MRYLYFWVDRSVGTLMPMFVALWQFGVFRSDTSIFQRMTGVGIFTVGLSGLVFYKDFVKWTQTLSNTASQFSQVSKPAVIGWIVMVCLWWAQSGIYQLMWVAGSYAVLNSVLIPVKAKHSLIVSNVIKQKEHSI